MITVFFPRLGYGPGRTDIIIIEKLVPPFFGMHHETVIVYQQHVIRFNIPAKLVDYLIVKSVDIIEL